MSMLWECKYIRGRITEDIKLGVFWVNITNFKRLKYIILTLYYFYVIFGSKYLSNIPNKICFKWITILIIEKLVL